MTAFTTCPFLTLLSGVASFTDAVTMSPSLAYRPVDPPIGLMMAILRAPELSATSRIDRIWIMGLYLHGLANDALQTPALAAALRARLDDLDGVPDLRRVVLVMDHELRRPALRLAVQAVAHVPLDRDDAALLHLVADDDAGLLCFLRHNESCRQVGLDGRDRQEWFPARPARPAYPALFCLRNVFTRARSRRVVRIRSGTSSWPIDFWSRILKS